MSTELRAPVRAHVRGHVAAPAMPSRGADAGQAVPDPSAMYGVVRLLSWPNLTRLPVDSVPLVARVCALVERKPTTASLIPLVLDRPRHEVFLVLDRLRQQGHVQWSPAFAGTGAEAIAAPGAADLPAAPAGHPPDSLLSKLWNKLLGRAAG